MEFQSDRYIFEQSTEIMQDGKHFEDEQNFFFLLQYNLFLKYLSLLNEFVWIAKRIS